MAQITLKPRALRSGALIAACAGLSACASMKVPDNIEAVDAGGGYQAQYREPARVSSKSRYLQSAQINQDKCLPYIGGEEMASVAKWSGPDLGTLLGEKLSRGDIVQIAIDEDEMLSGTYVVSRDGTLKLPYLAPVAAQGRSTDQVERDLTQALMMADFYEQPPRLTVRINDFASVTVGVSGAVFEAHAVQIGGVSGDAVDRERQTNMGSSTEGRNLSAALRAAGGVRPDADLSAVELHRAGRRYQMDLRGVFEGSDPTDIMLLTGDEIVVKSRQCFQDDLMRPSPVSPPGVSLFLSNLTQPATGNALSAIGRDVREVPYGTRYVQAVIDTNCVGGAKVSNANRSAVLYSRNPVTQVSVVIERNIEKLLRRGDRDDYDPYVLPGDAIACYDSKVTNLAEVGRIVGGVAGGVAGAALMLGN
ncbi:polysaccharide biosynthesis/export family protein [Primorskyibacter sp. S187A]|uniref:polysaccharide biosynthesis/export family protein n=1 Tax=Primorskyibacter sp. S187A TaxID=3415130 RepID=UPI003C7A5F25